MALAKDYDDLVRRLDAATTALGEKIKKLTDEQTAGNMTAEQEDANLAALSAIGDQLIAMGKDPNDPVATAKIKH